MNFINLTVESINLEGNRMVIKSGGKSYSFFISKNDGTESRAYSDMKRLSLQIGQTYSFGVSETQGKAKDGRDITYRNIGVISEARNNSPANSQQSQQTTQHTQNQNEYSQITPVEVKIISGMKKIVEEQKKLYDMLFAIKQGLPKNPASEIFEGDNIAQDLENVGLKQPNPVEEIPLVGETNTSDLPF